MLVPRLVEEALGHQRVAGGHRPQRHGRGGQVVDDLRRGGRGEAQLVLQPGGGFVARSLAHSFGHLLAQPRDGDRQLLGPRRRLAQPEGDVRRLPLGVLYQHPPLLDLDDPPRGVAELEDVPGQALDGEVLVHRADRGAGGLEHDLVVGEVGDRAARGHRRQPRSLAGAQHAVHRVLVEIGPAPAAPRGEAGREHLDDGVEVLPLEVAERPGAPDQGEQPVLGPLLGRHGGHDVLGQDVERPLRDDQAIELAAANGVHQGGALDQLVAGEREEPPLGEAAEVVPGAADPLQQGGDRPRRAELADEVDRADVDPQLQRRRGHQGGELAGLEAALALQPLLLGQAAVVGRHPLRPQPLGEMAGDPLGHPPGVGEDQRRPVLADQIGQPVVDLRPDLHRHHRFERRGGWHLDPQIEPPAVPGVHDHAPGGAVRLHVGGADQEAGDLLDRALGGREADAVQIPPDQRLQPLQRQRQVGAALVVRHGVDLVHDHRADVLQHPPPPLAGEQDEQRLRGGDQDVRRPLDHRRPHGRRGIPRAHLGADLDVRQPHRRQLAADPRQRLLQVLLDVVRQRLEWRDVDHRRLVRQSVSDQGPAHQIVDRREERRQRLARAGRGGDQRMAAGLDLRPGARLRLGRRAEALREPGGDGGVEVGEWHGAIRA